MQRMWSYSIPLPNVVKETILTNTHIIIVKMYNVRNTIKKSTLIIALIAKMELLIPEKVKDVPMDCAFAQNV